jgi:hypothetical protein
LGPFLGGVLIIAFHLVLRGGGFRISCAFLQWGIQYFPPGFSNGHPIVHLILQGGSFLTSGPFCHPWSCFGFSHDFFYMLMLEIFCEGGIFTNYLLTLKNYVHKVLVQKKCTRKINVEWKCLRTKMYWSRLAKNYYDLEKINVEWSGPLTTALISVSPKIITTSKK